MSGSKKGKLFVMNMTLEADPDNPSETKVILKHGWNNQVLPGKEKSEGSKKRKIKEVLESSEEREPSSAESDGETSTVSDSEYLVKKRVGRIMQVAYKSCRQSTRRPDRAVSPPKSIKSEFKDMKNESLFPSEWRDHMALLKHRVSIAKCGICNKKLRSTENARKHYHSRLHIRKHVEAIDRDCVDEELKISKCMGKELRSLPEYIPLDSY